MKIWDGYSPFDHPLQYAFCGPALVLDTENAADQQIWKLVDIPGRAVERYNRCPACEQWSPCQVRKET